MKPYLQLDKNELVAELAAVKEKYDKFCSMNLKLDMSRGKPSPSQLDLSNALLDALPSSESHNASDGTDTRNYGVLEGLPEARQLMASMMGVRPEQVIVGGNSSLNLMFDFLIQAMAKGLGDRPWLLQGQVKFICPSPGYDRHFGICEYLGIEMIPVAMLADGPDMDEVERLITDPLVKGMWCVPKYSNPQGITYSDETVRRIAAMRPAAGDFRVMWDNAYCIHRVGREDDSLLNILDECAAAGNPDLAVMFASTSKVTFPGAGISAIAAGEGNLKLIRQRMQKQTIGYDKVNQLRHVRMFPDSDALLRHMEKNSEILEPKFKTVLEILSRELDGLGVASWTEPNGGYFVSVDTLPQCASRTVTLCREAGVVLTGAGATYPYGKDPLDSNIRIAPSYPTVEELAAAMELFVTAVKLSALEMLSAQ